MSEYSLALHPDSTSPVASVKVVIRRAASGTLRLTYHLSGALDDVAFPEAQPPLRTDELWKRSCFEAFLAAGDAYYELNFSPSSQWAAYHFDAYRTGMRAAAMPSPSIAWLREPEKAQLAATVHVPSDATGPLALSTVIEDLAGNRSFWALAHAPGPPDFHHTACFAAQLPPAG
jgi:hypothetical protein